MNVKNKKHNTSKYIYVLCVATRGREVPSPIPKERETQQQHTNSNNYNNYMKINEKLKQFPFSATLILSQTHAA